MSRPDPRCPRCTATYPWGTTVCPTCHVALDLYEAGGREQPATLIFETWDRPSADIVVGLLEVHGIPCLVRGTGEAVHFGIGPQSFWRVFVRASDDARAQAVLDAEIGREEDG